MNLSKNDGFDFDFKNKLNQGMFGVVYDVCYENKNFVVKKISLEN